MTALGNRIQERLSLLGWTQTDLAWVLGIARERVCATIAGRSGFSPTSAVAFGAALGLDAAELLALYNARKLAALKPNADVTERRAVLLARDKRCGVVARGEALS